jgi:ATP-dependent RNA helicase DeaD
MTKMTALTRLLEVTPYQRALIFVRTRQDTMDVAELLQRSGFKASPLSGDLNQAQREQTVSQLRSGHIEILVATDVVARGLDVPEITHVINYDLPSDTESYVHRIGRTGRAGRSGEAILFFRAKERHLLRHYERLTNAPVEFFEVPNANQLSQHRQQQLLEKLQASMQADNAHADSDKLKKLLGQWLESDELSAEDLALALLTEQHKQRPLFLKEDRPVREMRSERPGRNERGDKRKPRAERGGRAADIDFDTYKIQVGKEHGARPGDIVGAIANEASMDSKYIGQIQLFDNHALVQLPKGMPKDVMHVLKKARVRQQPMGLELSDEQVKRAPRPPRDRDARGPKRRQAGKGAARRFN